MTTQIADNLALYHGMAIVTFERDWYIPQNRKVIVNTPYATLTCYIKAKFSDEYYQILYMNKNTHLRYIGKGFIDIKDENN